ncbi:hypothetical protein H5154_21590 [Pseudoalteromonas sp. SR44-5]|uniref:Uncharacterized protein n=1 Tax=Pseudoalteromonas rhizosphaerae TaxID=2518973 RepID=A0ABW8KTU3_9GAMM|nr:MULTISPECIES: hypothetical protein [Pseudoalteromonas]MBB1335844.1 hypothetical protein [Pseudoalteromonas sp. SR41-6]MBB1344167.1 hypothetical protein [Pseudoalteromonas sp. SR45-6]MBB1368936.1 hypothetical protein [Pseudoalteromonas sp. SR44-5]MBB1418744.1 hypothetical protein [Pseudoalteromonas sp. SG44-1]MBB1422080.1 hypothetical protein [Pseudoalteromonas sp. SG43-7]
MLKECSLSILTALLISGCSVQSSEPTPKLQHALLTEPQGELIAQGIARLMRSEKIAVANDVFMKRSLMVVDNVTKTDELGNPIMGKQLNMPDRFELLIKNNLCFVRHLDSKATEPLPDVQCKVNDI